MRERIAAIIAEVDGRDIVVFGGLTIASVGFGMIAVPVGLIVFGLGLFYLGARPG